MTAAMAKTYQVVGECCHINIADATGGQSVQMLYKGALLPGGVDEDRIKHLLSSGLIKEVADTSQTIPPNAAVIPASPGEAGKQDAERGAALSGDAGQPSKRDSDAGSGAGEPAGDDVAGRRQAAREKLTALDGRAPDGRHSHDVLVEYLATQGGRYEDLVRAEKTDLVEMVKARQG